MKNGKTANFRLSVFHKSVQGASHIKNNTVCQDYSTAFFNKEKWQPRDRYAVAIVCDGHGSSDYFRSDVGSQLACRAAETAICGFMQRTSGVNSYKGIEQLKNQSDKFLQQLETSIITNWREAVANHLEKNPFSESEISLMSAKVRALYEQTPEQFVKPYGTTLIAVVWHQQFWFGIHIGDGKCVAHYENNTLDQPIPWDDACFLNVTTSLCDDNALSHFRHCFHTSNFPVALYVGTDGIDDTFGDDEKLYGFYKQVTTKFLNKQSNSRKELEDFLPVLSARGSGDDVSIACIINPQMKLYKK